MELYDREREQGIIQKSYNTVKDFTIDAYDKTKDFTVDAYKKTKEFLVGKTSIVSCVFLLAFLMLWYWIIYFIEKIIFKKFIKLFDIRKFKKL